MNGSTNASNIGGTVGSDTKPIKIVDGQAVAVTNNLIPDSVTTTTISLSNLIPNYSTGSMKITKIGSHMIIYNFCDVKITALIGYDVAVSQLPGGAYATNTPRAVLGDDANVSALAYIADGETYVKLRFSKANTYTSGSLIVFY